MRLETRTTDSKARLVLPKSFANSTVILEQISDTEIRVRRAKIVAEDDLPFEEASEIKLSARDRERFVKALLKPPSPNAALKKGAACHKARKESK